MQALPSVLRDFTTALAAAAPVPIAFAATACLGALGAALGSGALLRDGERLIRPNLYLLSIAHEGLAKSTALRLAYDPVVHQQAFLDSCEPEPVHDDADSYADPIDAAPLLFRQHIPKGQLLQTLSARPAEALALYHPYAQVPAQILLGSARPTLDEEVYLAAHRGTGLSTASRAPGPRVLKKPCLTLHWSLTPGSWDNLLASPSLRNSPLLPHSLCAYPESSPSTPPQSYPPEIHPSQADQPAGVLIVEQSGSPEIRPSQARHPDVHWGAQAPRLSPVAPRHRPAPSATCSLEPPLAPRPTIPATVKAAWADTIAALVPLNLAANPVEFPIAPAARDLLHAYEQETQTAAESTDPLQRDYTAHHPDLAWRLALLLHTTQIASQECATAVSAVLPSPAATRPAPRPKPQDSWGRPAYTPPPRPARPVTPIVSLPLPIPPVFQSPPELPAETAAAAITLMRWFAEQQARLLAHFHHQSDLLLLKKITRALNRANGTMTLGQITDRQNLSEQELHRLTAKFPHLLQITESPTEGPGRKSQLLSLRDQTEDPLNPSGAGSGHG